MEQAVTKFRTFSEARRGVKRAKSIYRNLGEGPAAQQIREMPFFFKYKLPVNNITQARNKGKAKKLELSPLQALCCPVFSHLHE